MYAVVNTGGKQYKVGKGDSLRVEKLPGDVGSNVTFDKVLLFSDGETVRIGRPYLDDMKVNGHIVEQGKANKIIVFKYKKRKRYKRKQGHRQPFTLVRIDNIMSGGDMLTGGVEDAEETASVAPETVDMAPGDAEETTSVAPEAVDAASGEAEATAADDAPETAETAGETAVEQETDSGDQATAEDQEQRIQKDE